MKTLMIMIALFLVPNHALLTTGDMEKILAYAETKLGEYPLPENLDKLAMHAGKNLLKIRYEPYTGPKIRVGVLDVESGIALGEYDEEHQLFRQVPVGSIDAMVINGLLNTGRFTMVERTAVESLLEEQEKKENGMVTPGSGAKAGNMLGARYLVKLVITQFEPKYKAKNFGLGGWSGKMLGNAGYSTTQSLVELNVRLIDPQSGEIIFSHRAQSTISNKGFGAGGSKSSHKGKGGGSVQNMTKTPIGNALIVAVNVAIYELVKFIGNEPLHGKVITVKNDLAYINRGSEQVTVGDMFTAFTEGEALIDPETGLSLGGELTELGNMEIVKVQKGFSLGKAVDFDVNELLREDKVVSQGRFDGFGYAKKWLGPYPKMKKMKDKKNEKKRKKLDRKQAEADLAETGEH